MRVITKDLWGLFETSIGILDFFIVFFKNTKNAPISTILVGCGWLRNLSLLFGLRLSMPKLNSIR